MHLCLFSPLWIPCVCLCLPWHCYSLGNYSANKLGARPNTEPCFLGLIDSLDVFRVWSISVKSQFLTSGCAMGLSEASFRKYRQIIPDREQAGIWESDQEQKQWWRFVIEHNMSLKAPGEETQQGTEQFPCFSCHDLLDNMLSMTSCQATTCCCVPDEIPIDFTFKEFFTPLHLFFFLLLE